MSTPIILLPIGIPYTMTQDIEYAVPPMSIEIQSNNILQSSLTLGGSYSNVTTSLIVACFLKCVVGAAIVTLRKNGVG